MCSDLRKPIFLVTRITSALFTQVLAILWTENVLTDPTYHCVEIFSGKGRLNQAFRESGRNTAYFDWAHDERSMNFETSAGFGPLD